MLTNNCHMLALVPRVCDACKETDEHDNEIVDNLCKNDFGKSTSSLLVPRVALKGPERSVEMVHLAS